MSYRLESRSGNEAEFRDMVKRCNVAGVRIYVDIILNHMVAPDPNHPHPNGTAGAYGNPEEGYYPFIPFFPIEFHKRCPIVDYADPENARTCELHGYRDLNQTDLNVRYHQIYLLNTFVDAGVAGFRIDSAKHMWPTDLEHILGNMHNLSVPYGFRDGARPFIAQEVVDFGEGISGNDYTPLGTVIEIRFSDAIGRVFRGVNQKLNGLKNWGTGWGFLPSNLSMVFVDSRINQRGNIDPDRVVLTYKQPKLYKMANAFMLAHPYGTVRTMSSYEFEDPLVGPPQDKLERIVSPIFDSFGQCGPGWVCEHRWPQISNMVDFKNIVGDSELHGWWDNGGNQIAFCRGNSGFIAFNNDSEDMSKVLQTCLPAGRYCDVISGLASANGQCSGKTIIVAENGEAVIEIGMSEYDGVLAIHIGRRSFGLNF